jgi:hypothetical protein
MIAPGTYAAARLEELFDLGLARPRVPPKRITARSARLRKMAGVFHVNVRRMGTASVYWIADEQRCTYRRKGAACKLALPPTARLIGTYSGTCGAQRFLDDLVLTMKEAG